MNRRFLRRLCRRAATRVFMLSSALDRLATWLDTRFEPPRRVKPLRFRNEHEMRLSDLNEMFAPLLRRMAEAEVERIAASGLLWDAKKIVKVPE